MAEKAEAKKPDVSSLEGEDEFEEFAAEGAAGLDACMISHYHIAVHCMA